MFSRSAFLEGIEHCRSGGDISDNPYCSEFPLLRKWWFRGFEFYLNRDLFQEVIHEKS